MTSLSGVSGNRPDTQIQARLNRPRQAALPDAAVAGEDGRLAAQDFPNFVKPNLPVDARLDRLHAKLAVMLEHLARVANGLVVFSRFQIELVETHDRRQPARLRGDNHAIDEPPLHPWLAQARDDQHLLGVRDDQMLLDSLETISPSQHRPSRLDVLDHRLARLLAGFGDRQKSNEVPNHD